MRQFWERRWVRWSVYGLDVSGLRAVAGVDLSVRRLGGGGGSGC